MFRTACQAAAAVAASSLLLLLPLPGRRSPGAPPVPAGFVLIPAGPALLGSDDVDAEEDARPRRREWVGAFLISRTEVSHAEWRRFRPGHRIPAGAERAPITNVLRAEAEAYCRWAGGRLPSEAEWEKAARGTDGRRYPWGDRFDPALCHLGRPAAAPELCLAIGGRRPLARVDSFPGGASPYGVLHMAGNVWEWVADNYGGDPARGIIRGGAVGYGERSARTYSRAIEGTGVT